MARRGRIEEVDKAVAEAAAPARGTLAVRLLGQASELADQPQLITLCAATLGWGIGTRDRRLVRAGARMLAAELLATGLKSLVKHRVDRTRPHVTVDGGRYAMRRGSSGAPAYNSFPSGHTAGAVAVARALARDYPAARPAAYAAAAGVAAIQIPRCQHYPSDLAAGAGIGWLAATLVDAAFGALGSGPRARSAPNIPARLERPAPLPISRP